ncbi:MAG: aldo/keto reductase family protein [Lachnospiraceae bacterium]
MDSVTLHNGIQMPSIMLGSFQMKTQKEMDAVVSAAVSIGAFGFDTSPSYQTETLLAKSILNPENGSSSLSRKDFFLTSKIDSWQMIAKNGDIRPFVSSVLKKTNLEYWDLLLIHWPQPENFVNTWKSFEKVYEEGMVKSIGICNCQLRHFKKLEDGGANIAPMVAQNEIHPMNLENELVEYCKKNGIVVQAYSPLCRMLPMIKNNALLNILAEKYGVSVAQLILKWHVTRGLVPVVKTSNPNRVVENTCLGDYSLEEKDIEAINQLDRHFKIFLESRCCPGF